LYPHGPSAGFILGPYAHILCSFRGVELRRVDLVLRPGGFFVCSCSDNFGHEFRGKPLPLDLDMIEKPN
jgi:hypothetical protein